MIPSLTPSTRTPWGGTNIAKTWKPHLQLAAGTRIGEAWELSVDPRFPSRLPTGESLADAIARDPAYATGAADGECTLLLKLLDAAEPLSVQIHPSDDYEGLRADESGKPEAWFIADAIEGGGLYLGFRDGVDEATVRRALESGADVSALMNFVPVERGDFFLIEAGTPHAIGAGVTLIEPQRVLAGRHGVTYRYWDWGRRYDGDGAPVDAPDGEPRELHVEHALAVTDWRRVSASAFPATVKVAGNAWEPEAPSRIIGLCGRFGGLASDSLDVARLVGAGPLELPAGGMAGLFVLEGQVRFGDGTAIRAGHAAAIPAALSGSLITLEATDAILCAAAPR